MLKTNLHSNQLSHKTCQYRVLKMTSQLWKMAQERLRSSLCDAACVVLGEELQKLTTSTTLTGTCRSCAGALGCGVEQQRTW